MTNLTLPTLSAGSAVSTGDLLLTRQGADTSDKKITITQLKAFLLASTGAFTAQQNFTAAAITSTSNSIAWNLSTAQVATHTATENTLLANPTNMVAGGTYIFIYTQHASAAKTFAFGSAYKWPGGVVPVASTAVGSVDIYTFISNGTNMYGSQQQAFQ